MSEVERLAKENEKLRNGISLMFEKSALKYSPAYREQGAKMAELEAERDALKAKCEELKKALKGIFEITDRDHVAWDKAHAAIEARPQTCLAEIEARAIRKVAEVVSDKVGYKLNTQAALGAGVFYSELLDAAERLRQQAEDL